MCVFLGHNTGVQPQSHKPDTLIQGCWHRFGLCPMFDQGKKKIGGEDGMAGENRLIRLYNSPDRIIYTYI